MLEDMIRLASNFTIQQFLTRENFRKRWDSDQPVYFHELFYAIMQGYDAYKLETDVQVGGTDQMFNIMTAGRKIMAYFDKQPNIGVILPILPGTDGELKMSKSLGNDIPLETTPEDMFGKVMSIPDKAMGSYSRLVTRWTNEQISAFEQAMKSGDLHPRDAKMELAKEITSAFFGDEAADHAKGEFIKMFQKGDMPDDIPEFHPEGEPVLLEILVDSGLVKSKSQARRLIDQNGVKLDGEAAKDPYELISEGVIIQVGKRRFVKVI
jgi:tyrosyl-tRNA synthetase